MMNLMRARENMNIRIWKSIFESRPERQTNYSMFSRILNLGGSASEHTITSALITIPLLILTLNGVGRRTLSCILKY